MHRVKKEIIEKQKEVGVLAEKKEAEPVMRIIKIEKEVPNVKPKNEQKTTISVVKSNNTVKEKVAFLKKKMKELEVKIQEIKRVIERINDQLNYCKLKVEQRLNLNNRKKTKEIELKAREQELKMIGQELERMPVANGGFVARLLGQRQRAA